MLSKPNSLSSIQAENRDLTVRWLGAFKRAGAQLTSDSRAIEAGDVFVAYPFDAKNDGRAFAEKAMARRAGAVLWHDDGMAVEVDGAHLAIADLNVLAGHIAHEYYDRPSSSMTMIALTGTNGKTSCAQWVAQLLSAADQKCAIMGTLGVGFDGAMIETGFTTPQAIEVHKLLAGVKSQGAQAVAMEVSSHALEQGRVNGVAFDVALFTNLSRDHLDYHGDMAAYEIAKAQLFARSGLKSAVINMDDEAGVRMAQIAVANGVRVFGYGLKAAPSNVSEYLQAVEINQSGAQTVFELRFKGQAYRVESSVVGEFNVMNLLAVLGAMVATGHALSDVVLLCKNIVAAAGRMQRFGGSIDGVNMPLVVVDFAHTPDALEKTLLALRPIVAARGGKLTCLFGCGGDRDTGKRPQMGEIAARLADTVVVTSDNSRTESPQLIIENILIGTRNATVTVLAEIDRRVAVDQTIANAQANDVILVAGKGHEPYLDVMRVKQPYSDIEQVQKALQHWTVEGLKK